MVNGTLLNFGKKYEDPLRVIFDQWLKLHLDLDSLSNQKCLKGTYLRTDTHATTFCSVGNASHNYLKYLLK